MKSGRSHAAAAGRTGDRADCGALPSVGREGASQRLRAPPPLLRRTIQVCCRRPPTWNRLCLCFATVLTVSTVLYGHYYTLPVSPRTRARQKAPSDVPNQTKFSHSQEKSGSPCLGSLKSKVKADVLYGKLFSFSVPVLMWDRHFTPATWDSLRERKTPYGWHGLPFSVLSSTLQLLNDSANSWLFDARPPESCIRCAVVGNGGILNGSRQGKEIDDHNFVFRLNGAVIQGFEEDVGTKTSFYGFTVNTMKNSLIAYGEYGFTRTPQSKDLRYIFIPSDIRDYLMLKSAILGIPVPEGNDKGDKPSMYFGPQASAKKFKLLHPDFLQYLRDRFLRSNLIKSKNGYLYMPSTGALMLLTALHTCDQVSAYGFITDHYKNFSDHYYDRVKNPLVFYSNHDMLLESKLWKGLHQHGILKLYQRRG